MSQTAVKSLQDAAAIAGFMVEKHEMQVSSRVLMWRELFSEFCESSGHAMPLWIRDCREVHAHMKQYAKAVRAILEQEYGLLTCTVNNNVRKYIKHGESPRRDDIRTDAWYRRCVPSAKNPTMGIATFLRNLDMNHPLLLCFLERRMLQSASMYRGSAGSVSKAAERGNISRDARDRIAMQVLPSMELAIEEIKRPMTESAAVPRIEMDE